MAKKKITILFGMDGLDWIAAWTGFLVGLIGIGIDRGLNWGLF